MCNAARCACGTPRILPSSPLACHSPYRTTLPSTPPGRRPPHPLLSPRSNRRCKRARATLHCNPSHRSSTIRRPCRCSCTHWPGCSSTPRWCRRSRRHGSPSDPCASQHMPSGLRMTCVGVPPVLRTPSELRSNPNNSERASGDHSAPSDTEGLRANSDRLFIELRVKRSNFERALGELRANSGRSPSECSTNSG